MNKNDYNKLELLITLVESIDRMSFEKSVKNLYEDKEKLKFAFISKRRACKMNANVSRLNRILIGNGFTQIQCANINSMSSEMY